MSLLLLLLAPALRAQDCPPLGAAPLTGELARIVARMPPADLSGVAAAEPAMQELVARWRERLSGQGPDALDRHMRSWASWLREHGKGLDRDGWRDKLAAILAARQLLAQAVARDASHHPDATEQFRRTDTASLRRALAHFDSVLGDRARRAEWGRQLAAGGKNLDDGVVQVEMLRQELNRRELAGHGGLPAGVSKVPAGERKDVESVLQQLLSGRYTLAEGFHGRKGDWEFQVLSPAATNQQFLYLRRATGRSGEVVLVRLGATPRVLRIEWKPSESLHAGLTVLGAEGTAMVGSSGVDLTAMAYIGKGELSAGLVTVKGYVGGIGLRLSMKDGKVTLGAVAGLGGEVQVDVIGLAEGAVAADQALAHELAETSTLSWHAGEDGDWILPNGSRASRAWVRTMMNRPGFHVLP